MIVPVTDLTDGRTRELAVFPHPPLSHELAGGQERTILILDVLDPNFRMQLTPRGATHLITLLEMAVERGT